MAKSTALQEMIKALRDEYKEYMYSLRSGELDAIKKHVTGPYEGFAPWGSEFEGIEGYTENLPRGMYGSKELNQELMDMMMDAPRLPFSLDLYHGTARPVDRPWRDYPRSTTVDPAHALDYAPFSFDPGPPAGRLERYIVPKGSPGLFLHDEPLFDLLGKVNMEDEFLLPKGLLDLIGKYEVNLDDPFAMPSDKPVLGRRRRHKVPVHEFKYSPPFKAEGGLVRG